MKRYLYILLGALSLVSCKPEVHTPNVEYHFGEMSAEVRDNSATITADIPYMTIDGTKDESATFKFRYSLANSNSVLNDSITVEGYAIEGDKAIFEIRGLMPETEYVGYLILSSPNSEGRSSQPLNFTTKAHIPECTISCQTVVDAKGIFANISFNSVAYLVDGMEQAIESVKFEYALKASNSEWTAVDATNKDSITIPAEGVAWLEEKSQYIYRVTITPKAEEYKAITSAELEFTTLYAEITAEISKPEVTIVGDNIEVEVESIKVLFDGVERTDYGNVKQYIFYREANTEQWDKIDIKDGDMRTSLDIALFTEGQSYEFAGAVEVGSENSVYLSEVATITIPKTEEPTPPTPPTPPISGDADTSDIAGSWRLTEWRGTEPSFDVYLLITEDGVITLWQRIESREWEQFISVVGFENGIISGEYSDGVAWSTSYSVALGDNTMTWIDTTDSTDISIYTRSELPEITYSETTRATSSRVRFL